MRLSLPFQRVLMTGGAGFVGRHLVPMLAARLPEGASVTLASRVSRPEGVHRWVAFDLADGASVNEAVRAVRPDLLVHLAAQASVSQSLTDPAATWSTNVCGTLALGRAVAAYAPDCTVLQVSSAEIYGLTFNCEIASENSLLEPQSAYARSKAAAEAMLADVLPLSTRLIIARPANHSGPGQDERFVIPTFAAQIARIERGQATEIRVGNLDVERDFLDVRDIAGAYLALLEAAPTLPVRCICNVSSGRTTRIREILSRLQAMSRVETPISEDFVRMRPSEVPRAAVDNGLLRSLTDWSAEYDLDAMLGDVLAEWRAKLSR